MLSILNNSARQFNLKKFKDKKVTTVRLIPGLNAVKPDQWKLVSSVKFVKDLIADGIIELNTPKVENLELTTEPHVSVNGVKGVKGTQAASQ